jgi:hypothetical protein
MFPRQILIYLDSIMPTFTLPPMPPVRTCSVWAEVQFANPRDSTSLAARPVKSELKSPHTALSHASRSFAAAAVVPPRV